MSFFTARSYGACTLALANANNFNAIAANFLSVILLKLCYLLLTAGGRLQLARRQRP